VVLCFEPCAFRQGNPAERHRSYWAGYFGVSALIVAASWCCAASASPSACRLFEVLDDVMYKSIAVGFAFFTIATVLGALWAAEAWGGYWSWDPKETWALIVWLNYAAWLHMRLMKGLRGTVSAWWALVGLAVTTFAFLGVNMFLSGCIRTASWSTMRTNLPVSQTEYVLPPDLTLVSVTDLKGRITYCNAAFVTASGYSQAELLGQPHNLVRHPDMPEEAFRDLWATLSPATPGQGAGEEPPQERRPLLGAANATPMRDGDRIVGYLSVRMAPSRAQIDACQALYARMQDEARGQRLRTGLRAGSVMRLDPVGRVAGALISALGRWGLDGMAPLAAAAGTGLAASLAGPVVWVPTAIVLATGAWALVRWRRETALQSLLGDALRLAAGDLRQLRSAPQHGRMGELQLALSQIGLNLRTAIADVRSEVESVRGAAAEIASGNQDLSSRTEAQASSLEQTAASMEQINGTVRRHAVVCRTGRTHGRRHGGRWPRAAAMRCREASRRRCRASARARTASARSSR
jgi:PAS domain S-box-containing protein